MPEDMQEKTEKGKTSPFYKPYDEDAMMRGPEDWYRCTNEYIKMPLGYNRENRDYFCTHPPAGWLDQPNKDRVEESCRRFAALYGQDALVLAKNLGIVPENSDPVWVGGSLVGPEGNKHHFIRPVYSGPPIKMADVADTITSLSARIAALEAKI